MAPEGHRAPPPLEERLREWVDLGIISDEQATAIEQFEGDHAGGRHREGGIRSPGGRLPLVAEVLAYLGIVLVTASGTLVVVRFWNDLLVGGRLGVGIVVAGLGLGSGALVGRAADAGARRLGSFLSLCGTGGVAIVAGVAATALGSDDPGVTALVVGLATLATSLDLWRNRDRLLPFSSSLVGAVAAAAGLVDTLGVHPTTAEIGWTAWGAGVALAGLGWRRVVRPPVAALVVGALGSLGGALAIADGHQAAGVTIGLVTAVVALGAGVVLRQPLLAGAGVAGLFVFLMRTIATYVQETAGAIVLLLAGVLLLAVAIGGWRRRGSGHPPASGDATPPAMD